MSPCDERESVTLVDEDDQPLGSCGKIEAHQDGKLHRAFSILITNADGGVIDDCIITNAGDHLYMVINAGHEDKDLPHMQKHLDAFKAAGGDAAFETLADNGILALQGPKAAEVLQRARVEERHQHGPAADASQLAQDVDSLDRCRDVLQ